MALKDTLKDPLNWVLLILALLFGYYVTGIPYWQNYYLKTPQEMTMAEYLANPSHPRAFMFRSFGTPPSSVEILITDLTVAHVDSDSLLLEASSIAAAADPMPPPPPSTSTNADADPGQNDENRPLAPGPEQPPPNNQILIAGENMDLLEVSIGQQIDLQVHGLYESPLGWIPQHPELESSDEEMFTAEELDDIELIKVLADGNRITAPYVETGEMRFADGSFAPGEPATLDELENDTTYIQTVNRLSGGSVDLHDVRLTAKRFENLAPYFVVQDAEGRVARVYYNQRLLTEWYWALDRLGNREVVVRGTLRGVAPAVLRQLASDGNVQALMDGQEILSADGTVVISLENPSGRGLGISGSGTAGQ